MPKTNSSLTLSNIAVGQKFQESRVFARNLSSATFEEIIVKLVVDRENDEFTQVFLTTYHTVCSPNELLSALIDLFENPTTVAIIPAPKEDRRKTFDTPMLIHRTSCGDLAISPGSSDNSFRSFLRIASITVLKIWIGMFLDFFVYPSLVSRVTEFLATISPMDRLIKNMIEEALTNFHKMKETVEIEAKRTRYPNGTDSQHFSFLSKISVETIAKQISLMELSMVQSIYPSSLLKNKESAASITTYYEHFEGMKKLVEAELILETNPKNCSSLMKRAISIAACCYTYQNFNGVAEILSALLSPKLVSEEKSKAWEALDGKSFKQLQELVSALSSQENFANYQCLLGQVKSTSVPFLGAHIQEIQFIDDFHRTKVTGGLNLAKLDLLYSEIKKIERFCGKYDIRYEWAPDVELQQKIVGSFQKASEVVARCYEDNPVLIHYDSTPTPRSQALRDLFENFAMGDKYLNFHLLCLRPRDWSVISTSAKQIVYKASEIIKDNTLKVDGLQILRSGSVSIQRSGVELRTLSAPAILGYSQILDCADDNTTICAASECTLELIPKNLLVLMLQGDSHLSMRFFSSLAFQLIELLRQASSNVLENEARERGDTRVPQALRGRVVQPANPLANSSVSSPTPDFETDLDSKFRKLFDLPADEVVLREFKATLVSKTISAQGTIYISSHYFSFFSPKLGIHKRKRKSKLLDEEI